MGFFSKGYRDYDYKPRYYKSDKEGHPFKIEYKLYTKMSTLKIAIQKSGRLNEESLQLLKECGISIDHRNAQLKATARNFPLEVFYLRNGDIPQYLEDGVVDIAILGENTLIEKGENLPIVERLGFSKCKVSLAVPKDVDYKDISFFEGCASIEMDSFKLLLLRIIESFRVIKYFNFIIESFWR